MTVSAQSETVMNLSYLDVPIQKIGRFMELHEQVTNMALGEKRTLQGQWVVSHYYGSGPSIVVQDNYAKYLGILFQVKDDLLDYSLKEEVIGKPVFQDMREGKVTYPFYFAYKNADKNDKAKLKAYLGKNKFNIEKAYNLINQLNGIKETELLASKYLNKAVTAANSIKNKHIKEEMLKLINSALYRKK